MPEPWYQIAELLKKISATELFVIKRKGRNEILVAPFYLDCGCPNHYNVKSFMYKHKLVNNATVAQLVEQLICNQPVGGSSPLGGSILSETCDILLI